MCHLTLPAALKTGFALSVYQKVACIRQGSSPVIKCLPLLSELCTHWRGLVMMMSSAEASFMYAPNTECSFHISYFLTAHYSMLPPCLVLFCCAPPVHSEVQAKIIPLIHPVLPGNKLSQQPIKWEGIWGDLKMELTKKTNIAFCWRDIILIFLCIPWRMKIQSVHLLSLCRRANISLLHNLK